MIDFRNLQDESSADFQEWIKVTRLAGMGAHLHALSGKRDFFVYSEPGADGYGYTLREIDDGSLAMIPVEIAQQIRDLATQCNYENAFILLLRVTNGPELGAFLAIVDYDEAHHRMAIELIQDRLNQGTNLPIKP